jgi:hypothetical protein
MGYGYGSVYQRASDGRWLAAVELPRRPGEPRRRAHRSGRTREEAEMRLAAYRADHPAFEVEITGNRATKLLHASSPGDAHPEGMVGASPLRRLRLRLLRRQDEHLQHGARPHHPRLSWWVGRDRQPRPRLP